MNAAIERIVVNLVLALVVAGCAGPTLQSRKSAPIENRVPSQEISPQEAVARADALGVEAITTRGGVARPSIQIAKAEESYRTPPPLNVAVQSLVAAAMQSVGRGEWDRAQAALERALKISPNDSSLWTQLAYTHYRQGTLKQAGELAQRALSLASARAAEQAAAFATPAARRRFAMGRRGRTACYRERLRRNRRTHRAGGAAARRAAGKRSGNRRDTRPGGHRLANSRYLVRRRSRDHRVAASPSHCKATATGRGGECGLSQFIF